MRCICFIITLLVFHVKGASGIQLESRRQALQRSAQLAASLLVAPSEIITESSLADPSRLLLSAERGLSIPRVGYSLYKTTEDQVADGVLLALQAGVRHLDTGSQYGPTTNVILGKVLQSYIKRGVEAKSSDYEAFLSSSKDVAAAEKLIETTNSMGRPQRRQDLFLTHKVSNAEQSTSQRQVMRAVQQQRSNLKLDYIDLAMIHSPLTDSSRRLVTYQALLELQTRGIVRSVGVANYGVGPLQEIVDAGLPAPAVIQLILSPFHRHHEVIDWANQHGSVVSCSAWSKLSSAEGPQKGWSVLADIAQQRKMTKAQVLVRWAVQMGYVCVPRSSAKFKVESRAIFENSWEGTKSLVLTEAEMKTLNALDEQLPAGRLGITDGWDAPDIVNEQWDPTLIV
jgi:diketogulonate reductase-like aldo/keto reductase